MKNRRISLMMLSVLMCSSSMVYAQKKSVKKDTIRESQIEEIYVKGHSLKHKNTTSTINVITNDEIKNLVVEQPLRVLEQLPGINVIGYGQGGVADQFSMRGFAGGGHEGQAGIEIDGVSLNEAEGHSDGYADLNVLIPINLRKITVYKGPSSALHGRFSQAGTVSLETRKGGNYNDVRLSGGSYSTFDAQYAMGKMMKVGNREDALKVNLAAQVFNTNGYIKNSGILKGNFSGRLAYQLSNSSEIAVSVLGHRSEWDAPGYIPREQYLNRAMRNRPHETAQHDGGGKAFLSERVDFNHKISDNVKLLVFGYAVQQDFTRYAKFRYNVGGQREDYNKRRVYAIGGSFNGNTHLAGKEFNWIGGVEFYTENTDSQRYATTFRRRNSQTWNRSYQIQTYSAYAQGELDIHPLFRPSVGLRFDIFGGYYEDLGNGTSITRKHIKNLSHFSPKLGFRSTLANNFDFKVNVSNGFTLPQSDVRYGTEMKPVRLWQYEAAFVYDNQKNLYFNVTGFILNSSREILERPLGSGMYQNAGRTRRNGIETEAKVNITEGLMLRGSYTYTHTKIVEGDNKGNELVMLPRNMFNAGATYTSPIGLGADLQFRVISNYYTDDENTFRDGAYNVFNLKVFYNFDKLFSSKGNIFVGMNNLFNKHYAETIFGTNMYSASPTFNVMAGVNYSF